MVKADHGRITLWAWEPNQLTWWIAILFMTGASLFSFGCILFLKNFQDAFLNGLIFFIGSVFFTSAAYCQYYQAINVGGDSKKLFYRMPIDKEEFAALIQFIGTIFFNFNTLDSLFNLGFIGQELLIWIPNIVGSLLFQISATVAMFEISPHWWNVKNRDVSWWAGVISFMGCVTFMISACLAIVIPHPVHVLVQWATVFTLIGAICFFISAYLLIPELLMRGSKSIVQQAAD